jgi:hypothetical protein
MRYQTWWDFEGGKGYLKVSKAEETRSSAGSEKVVVGSNKMSMTVSFLANRSYNICSVDRYHKMTNLIAVIIT